QWERQGLEIQRLRRLDESADLVMGVAPLIEQGGAVRQALASERGAVGPERIERVRLVHEPRDADAHARYPFSGPDDAHSCSTHSALGSPRHIRRTCRCSYRPCRFSHDRAAALPSGTSTKANVPAWRRQTSANSSGPASAVAMQGPTN